MNDHQWTRDEIDQLLMTKTSAVERGIVKLFQLQTNDEQSSFETKHNNGVGFSGYSARSGTFFAKAILNSDKPEGQRLWGRGLEECRAICLRHSRQLVEVANGNLACQV